MNDKTLRHPLLQDNEAHEGRQVKGSRGTMVVALLTMVLAGCGGGNNTVDASPYAADRDSVPVSGGMITAAADSKSDMRIFRAIPYASPPVGSLRWKAPQPVVAWTGVRRSDNFSAACMQGNRPSGQIGSILYQQTESQSEDCLYLNVWTGAQPGAGEKRPVMVLLHGGGYQLGAGSQPNYNGKGLASKGAVVVTLNYRLGPLGFLAHPELSKESSARVSGNYALLDAIAVLQWIKLNIATFGGDPTNVTIYSESAGGGLSSVLLASPKATGLFHKLVMESLASLPAGTANPTLSQAEAAGTTFAKNLGAANIAALRSMSASEIMAGSGAVVGPIVDGAVLPDQLDTLYKAGKVNDVPLLLGWNADEGTPYPPFATSLATYRSAVAQFGTFASQFEAAYPVSTDSDVLNMAYQPMRDNTFAWQIWTVARWHASQSKAPTYLYFFTRRPSYFAGQSFTGQSSPEKFGAYHSLEQVYFYNNLDVSAPARPYDTIDRQIAATASSYLINFARTGNPNSVSLPTWPLFTGKSGQTMEIGDTIAPRTVPFLPALDFWDQYYTSRLGRPLPF